MHHNLEIIKLNDGLHHCSSITEFNNGHILTFYLGPECKDPQHVVLMAFCNDGSKHILELEEKTGNPIVFSHNTRTYIWFSAFTDAEEDGTPIDYGRYLVRRWMNCNNYFAEVTVSDTGIHLHRLRKVDGAYGLLARCQPIEYNGALLLPLYREKDPMCQIWTFNEEMPVKVSEFGDNLAPDTPQQQNGSLGDGVAIQPSLYITDKGNLAAVCRNVTRGKLDDDSRAWFTWSENGVSWAPLRQANMPNHNNSIVTINYGDKILSVLNNNRTRSTMLLHCGDKAVNIGHPLPNFRQSYSYPNYCVDADGTLNIVHTNCGRIAWHQYDKDMIDEIFSEERFKENR